MVGSDRQSWHIDKAARFLAAADRALESEDWETAISRAYYGLYHAVIAVMETKAGIQRPRWDHIQLQRDFRQHFARRGFLFSISDAANFERLQRYRIAADYDRADLPRRDVINLLRFAHDFYDRIVEAIRNV